MVTIKAMASLDIARPGAARPSVAAALSAVTHGMPAMHACCDVSEHGAWSGVAEPFAPPGVRPVVSAVAEVSISAMESSMAGEDALMAAIPGVVHTAPPVTALR